MDNSETDINLIVGSDVGMTVLMFACRHGHKDVVKLELNITYSGHFRQSPTGGIDPHLQGKT